MVITYMDFQDMSPAEQAEAVWTSGTFFGERREQGLWIQCYSLVGFYVEVFYDDRENRLLRFEAFTQLALLRPYLLLHLNQAGVTDPDVQ